MAVVIRPSRSSRRALNAPRSARLSASVPPLVNTISLGSALIVAATSSRARSTPARAARHNQPPERAPRAQIENAAHKADMVSSSFNDREVQLQSTIAALALTPTPDRSPIGLAIRRGDMATLQALVDTVQHLYARNILRIYIAVRGDAAIMAEAPIVVASPPGTDLVGRPVPPEVLRYCRRGCNDTDFFVTGGVSDDYPGTVDAPSVENLSAIIPGT